MNLPTPSYAPHTLHLADHYPAHRASVDLATFSEHTVGEWGARLWVTPVEFDEVKQGGGGGGGGGGGRGGTYMGLAPV
jgi:hypothetical protein